MNTESEENCLSEINSSVSTEKESNECFQKIKDTVCSNSSNSADNGDLESLSNQSARVSGNIMYCSNKIIVDNQ